MRGSRAVFDEGVRMPRRIHFGVVENAIVRDEDKEGRTDNLEDKGEGMHEEWEASVASGFRCHRTTR